MTADAKHAASAKCATVFPIGTYILCRYTDRPPTRLHTTWHGPYRVTSYKGYKYVLANLVTHKERNVHLKNPKKFNYDSEVDVPYRIFKFLQGHTPSADHLVFILF